MACRSKPIMHTHSSREHARRIKMERISVQFGMNSDNKISNHCVVGTRNEMCGKCAPGLLNCLGNWKSLPRSWCTADNSVSLSIRLSVSWHVHVLRFSTFIFYICHTNADRDNWNYIMVHCMLIYALATSTDRRRRQQLEMTANFLRVVAKRRK